MNADYIGRKIRSYTGDDQHWTLFHDCHCLNGVGHDFVKTQVTNTQIQFSKNNKLGPTLTSVAEITSISRISSNNVTTRTFSSFENESKSVPPRAEKLRTIYGMPFFWYTPLPLPNTSLTLSLKIHENPLDFDIEIFLFINFLESSFVIALGNNSV